MENLHVDGYSGTYFIPTVDFFAETGICQITGESYLEDTVEFYEPLLKWITEFTEIEDKPITLNIKLTYYNTSTARSILEILDILNTYKEEGGEVTVNWFYNPDEDTDTEEEVEDYMIESGMKINLLSIKDA